MSLELIQHDDGSIEIHDGDKIIPLEDIPRNSLDNLKKDCRRKMKSNIEYDLQVIERQLKEHEAWAHRYGE